MKIKHQELAIPKDNPFANCKLGRQKYALVLTDIVNAFPDGFVLAVNNEWGTGKTTFVKMWEQHLKNQKFQTIYFNAWENDFNSNPLVAIIAELKTIINTKNETAFKSVVEKGSVLVKNVVPALVKSLIKRYGVDVEEMADVVENTTKAATEILEEEISEYANKKKTISEFREQLEKFVKKSGSSKPLVFIIDELDRCRPDYAVEVLEQMKHFFSVPGIAFVLSIDKKHLAASVQGYYGSENINTDEYLRRFIDLEYSIPKPSAKEFVNYLYSYYAFSEFFESHQRMQIPQFQNDNELLIRMAELLFEESNTTLRQQEKIFAHTRLVLRMFGGNNYTFSSLLFVLVYIKTLKKDLYSKIEGNILTPQQLSHAFADLFSQDVESQDVQGINLGYVEALLLHLYNNQVEPSFRKALYTIIGTEFRSEVVSRINPGTGNGSLISLLRRMENERDFSRTPLFYLLNKINLTEPLVA